MKLLTLLLSLFTLPAMAQNDPYLIVGTYTDGKSDGIYVYRFNRTNGTADSVSMINTSNPSYLAISKDGRNVYAVNENDDSTKYFTGGSIAAFSFDKKSGQLTEINKQGSGGKHPCYVAIDKTGKWVFSGNYSSGSLAVLSIQPDGGLGHPSQVIEHTGSSVDENRQQGPHVHATVVSPDNKYLFVTDLGLDKVMIYGFSAKSGKLEAAKQPFQPTEAGSGPRHLTFHPNDRFAYLIEEMTGSISAYRYSKGKLELIQNMSALPGDFSGTVGSADIHVSPDGKFLYASNRGESNTIAIFEINKSTGEIMLAGHQSTLGKTPRNFSIDPSGEFLLVGNQNSDEIVIFRRDKVTGLLNDTGNRISVGKPVCLKWITNGK